MMNDNVVNAYYVVPLHLDKNTRFTQNKISIEIMLKHLSRIIDKKQKCT